MFCFDERSKRFFSSSSSESKTSCAYSAIQRRDVSSSPLCCIVTIYRSAVRGFPSGKKGTFLSSPFSVRQDRLAQALIDRNRPWHSCVRCVWMEWKEDLAALRQRSVQFATTRFEPGHYFFFFEKTFSVPCFLIYIWICLLILKHSDRINIVRSLLFLG